MKGNFENLTEGAVYRLNGREYCATYSRRAQGVWELRTLTTDHLSYIVMLNNEIVSMRTKIRLSGLTISDLEFIRAA